MIALTLLLAQAALPAPAPVAPAGEPEAIYRKRCVACHGEDFRGKTAKGKKLRAPDFTSARWQKHTTDDEIVDTITNGNKKHKMPAFKDKLSAAEIRSFVPYLRALATGTTSRDAH